VGADNDLPEEKIIPDVGTEKRKVQGARLLAIVGGVTVLVAVVLGVLWFGFQALRSGMQHSFQTMSRNGGEKAQGVVTVPPPRNLQQQALESVPASSDGSEVSPAGPQPAPAPGGHTSDSSKTASTGTAAAAHSSSCPTGTHAEPRFRPDGMAVEACVKGGVGPAPGAASDAVNPLDAPLELDTAGTTVGAEVAGAVHQVAAATGVSTPNEMGGLEAANTDIARNAAAAEEAVAASTKPHAQQTGYHLDEQFTATPLQGVSATRLGNLSLIWAKGEGADCVLDGRIDTTLSGYVTCTVSDDVYSADGQTVLVEKGSEGFVEYHSVEKAGQHRFAAIVSSIRTPDGVTFNLDSGAQGRLGETGASGYLDNQWGARLGAALVIALVGDLAQYEENRALSGGGGGTTVVSPQNTTQTLASMPQQVLASTLSIQPRIIKAQGESIRIVAARDINFATVYRLVHVNNATPSDRE
jgi:type IV secretion system protein VirB10